MMKRFWIIILLLFTNSFYAQDITPLSSCSDEQISDATMILGDYIPSTMQGYVTLDDNQLMLNGAVYPVRGINYYPAQYPWRRFLSESDSDTLIQELALMREANLNTLRIFVWNQAIFQCYGSAECL